MEGPESRGMELTLTLDRDGRILGGTFRGKDLPKRFLKGSIKIFLPGEKDEPEKGCKIVNGTFCCTPKVTGVPLCP